MRVVVQRVKRASCTVEGQITGSCNVGFCLFVGFKNEDTSEIIDKMIKKILNLRIFEDENGKMNRSILDVHGNILSISQFTLYANCKKGNRPSFTEAGKPDFASQMFDEFNFKLNQYIHCETGIFGADMKIDLLNDGPVTIWLDSKEIF